MVLPPSITRASSALVDRSQVVNTRAEEAARQVSSAASEPSPEATDGIMQVRDTSGTTQMTHANIGGIIGGSIAVLLLLLLAYACVRRPRQKRTLTTGSNDGEGQAEKGNMRANILPLGGRGETGSLSLRDREAETRPSVARVEVEGSPAKEIRSPSITTSRPRLAGQHELNSYPNERSIAVPPPLDLATPTTSPLPASAIAEEARSPFADPEDRISPLVGTTTFTFLGLRGTHSPFIAGEESINEATTTGRTSPIPSVIRSNDSHLTLDYPEPSLSHSYPSYLLFNPPTRSSTPSITAPSYSSPHNSRRDTIMSDGTYDTLPSYHSAQGTSGPTDTSPMVHSGSTRAIRMLPPLPSAAVSEPA
ncbi:hypothetical protein V5O48_013271 [Marasmius crinis-equi]|uniref:Uncharacterized protein n=1 Tax=Marasmius crinis-equi TaxID=585013 RepID=A0ABR3F0V9_9AGAR